MQEQDGVIVVNKHAGVTSFDIVFKIKKLFNTKKVGHTGTLDPMATGVLPILIGRSAKASEYLTAHDKVYVAEITLGITTDTEDISGKILEKSNTLPAKEAFFKACEAMVGEIEQIPPMYSALKVDGKKLCDLAREGIEIERKARSITVYKIEPKCIDEEKGVYEMYVKCSKGTYIRTLCADIGKMLGCGACMSKLERVESGNFKIDDAYTVDELEKMTCEERISALAPTESLFIELDNVILPDFYARLARSGCEIYQHKIKSSYPIDTFVRMSDKNGFFALGQVRQYENGTAIKAVKLFVL